MVRGNSGKSKCACHEKQYKKMLDAFKFTVQAHLQCRLRLTVSVFCLAVQLCAHSQRALSVRSKLSLEKFVLTTFDRGKIFSFEANTKRIQQTLVKTNSAAMNSMVKANKTFALL